MLAGIADFRRKKHGNLCTSFNYRTIQGRIKRARWDEQRYEPRGCRYRDFRRFLQEKMQALDFCFFWAKPKERALGGGEPRQD